MWTPSRSGFSEIESSDLPLGRLARGECDAAASVPGVDSLGRLRDQLELSRPYYGAAFELIAAAVVRRRSRLSPDAASASSSRASRTWRRSRCASTGAPGRRRGETLALLDTGEVDAALVWGPALATLDRARSQRGRRRARYAGTSTSRCVGDLPGFLRSIAPSNGSQHAGAIERMAREHGIPPRAPFETVSDASALAELRRNEVAKQ